MLYKKWTKRKEVTENSQKDVGGKPNKTLKNKKTGLKLKMAGLNNWLHTDKQKIINLEDFYWACSETWDGKYERDVEKHGGWNDKT